MGVFNDNSFLLMNKDVPILEFNIEYMEYNELKFVEGESYSKIRPYNYKDIQQWLEERQAPKHRTHIEELLKRCGCLNLDGYIRVTHALSLNDTFWVVEKNRDLKWDDVSLYKNEFNEVIAHIAFEGGLKGENFSSTSPEFGTDGTFAKCWVREDDEIYLMKAGSTGARNAGLEPYSELYVSQLAKHICNNHVDYSLVKYRSKLASKCALFTSENEGYVQASKLLPKRFYVEDLKNLYAKYGCADDFKRMLILDAMTVNVDRHTGNHGFIMDNNTMEIKRMAPIFDNNMALLPYAEQYDFNDGYKYLSEQESKIGRNFCEIAHKELTKELKAELKNLRDFKFDVSGKYNLPTERIKALENIVQLQIDGILDYKQYYIHIIEPNKEDESINNPIFSDSLSQELLKKNEMNKYIDNSYDYDIEN